MPTPAVLNSPPRDETVPAARPPSVPDYELLRCIGSGSYGDVWLARNILGQCRAVKFVYRSRFADPRPFEREFEGIQRFEPISRSHPSQLHILHVGKNDAEGCFYYVMELADAAEPGDSGLRRHDSALATSSIVWKATTDPTAQEKRSRASAVHVSRCAGQGEGGPTSQLSTQTPLNYVPRTLRSDLERHGRLPPADCVQIGLSLATALAHLHEQGLVHRDIKPSNIIFVNGVAKLGDIGLVTDAGDIKSIVGTEGYLPPEGPGTPQADLYSLGKVLYEISTGLDRRRFAALPEDSWTWPDRDQLMEFNEIVLRACAKDPAQRYQTAEQLRADLTLLQDGKSVRRIHGNQRLWASAKGSLRFGLIAAVVIVGVLLIAGRLPRSRPVTQPLSTNAEAVACYKQAVYLLQSSTPEALWLAYTNLSRAVTLDPSFVQAYSAFMDLYWADTDVAFPPYFNMRDNFGWVVAKLHETRPDSAEFHTVNSYFKFCDWRFDEAIAEAQLAIQRNPDSLRAHGVYGHHLQVVRGDIKAAKEQYAIAYGIDPADTMIQNIIGEAYYQERDFPRAIEQWNRLMRLEPRQTFAHFYLGRAYEANGQYEQALAAYETHDLVKSGENNKIRVRYARYRQALRENGPSGWWQAALADASASTNSHPYFVARLHALLGQQDPALEQLERAFAKRDWTMTLLLLDACWDPLRQDPLFRSLVRRVGLRAD